ncbi:MAG: SdpI family protein [Lysinibacillus sp.]
MIENNKWKLIVSSVVVLLPILAGLFLWNELPEQMTTHWGADGNADGWSSRTFAVVGLPLILLAVHWVCIFLTAKDPKNKDQNRKVFGMVLWICPVVSIFASGITYAAAFGKEFNMDIIVLLLIGLMFVVIGNYLPKCKQNYTIGIRVKWTLANEENWNATHRVGGKVWVIGGLLLMVCVFLPKAMIPWVLMIVLPILAVVPIVYSYVYYKKQVAAGTAPEKATVPISKWSKLISAVVLTGVTIMTAVLLVVLFTGNIEVQYGDTYFTLEASYWDDLTVEYAAIDSIEYRESCEAGSRVNGFGSPRLSMGAFQNDEFGNYTRYSYTKCESCVVLTVDGKILVVSGADAESTKAIYENLLTRL